MAREAFISRDNDSQSKNNPGPSACPYPFPIRWHRTIAQVMAEEARERELAA
ncbi:MAG: hypothetical protein RL268_162 [Pseudomonadota bacterium]|jgi:hypothetical protein